MRTMKECLVLAVLLSLAWSVQAADLPEIAHDWPEYMGPNGSLSSVTPGVTLSSDPSTYRLLWTSEERGLGCGKNSSGYPHPRWSADRPLPGGLASPILACGLVYLHYYRPKAGATATSYHNYQAPASGEDQPHYRILADDIDVAIDAATGRTVWRQVGEEPGLNLHTTKRFGWGVTGCVHEGRYFAMDTLGQVLAFEAKTGKRLWKAGDAARTRAEREKAVQAHNFADRKLELRGHLTVIGGLLIAPQYGSRLIALDPASGQERWNWKGDLSGFAAAGYRAVSERRELCLVPGGTGITCLDSADGNILWKVPGLTTNIIPIHGDRFLMVDCDGQAFKMEGEKGSHRTNARWTLYKAKPERAEQVWRSVVMTVPTGHSDGGPQQRAAIDGRYAFLPGTLESTPPLTPFTDLTAVDLETGKVAVHRKWKTEMGGNSKAGMWVTARWDNLLFSRSEADGDGVYGIRDVAPDRIETYHRWASVGHFHYGYQTVTMVAYGDGIAYVRHLDNGGCIQAWDLRR